MNPCSLATLLLPLALGLAAPAHPSQMGVAPGQATLGSPAAQDGGGKRKSKQDLEKTREAEAKEAVRTLTRALKSRLATERAAALTEAAEVDHPKVVAAIAKALKDNDPGVLRTALQLLGDMKDASAISALKSYARRARKELAKDGEKMALVIRSVGFHEHEESIDWLLDGAFSSEHRAVRQARLFAVARMRSMEGLESIFGAMAKEDPRRLNSRMRELRVSLIWLTSKDLGVDAQVWNDWWRKNRKTFEIPKAPPKLTGRDEQDWMVFWGEERMRERQKKRGDRG